MQDKVAMKKNTYLKKFGFTPYDTTFEKFWEVQSRDPSHNSKIFSTWWPPSSSSSWEVSESIRNSSWSAMASLQPRPCLWGDVKNFAGTKVIYPKYNKQWRLIFLVRESSILSNKLNFCCGNFSREETIQGQKLLLRIQIVAAIFQFCT